MFVACAHRSSSDNGDGDDDAKCRLVIASSADYVSNACVLSGPDIKAGKDCEIPGQLLLFVVLSFTSIML